MNVDIQMLKAKMAYLGITQTALAQSIGMDRGKLVRRIHDRDFRIQEIHSIMEILSLTMEKVQEIFFANKKHSTEKMFDIEGG